jgi:hypothetical protein
MLLLIHFGGHLFQCTIYNVQFSIIKNWIVSPVVCGYCYDSENHSAAAFESLGELPGGHSHRPAAVW